MTDVLLIVALSLVCLGGVLLTVFQLPGTWLILLVSVLYAWYYDWQRLGWWILGILAAMACLAEIVEMLAGVWFTRREGGSSRAGWWGLFGGIAGGLLLSVPLPVIGTMLGAAIGCFAGAFLAELSLAREAGSAARLGLHAALGFTAGTVLKIAAALMMTGLALARAVLAVI